MNSLTVKCPCCDAELLVDARTGKVLETRKPLSENSTGDRFEDARRKVAGQNERAEKLFEEARQKEKDKFARLEKLFAEKKEELKDQPIERPEHPLDFQ